jgi:hypothetical protein
VRVRPGLLDAAALIWMLGLALCVLRGCSPGTALGAGTDLWGTLWFFEWTAHALGTLQDPLHSSWGYWPVGEDLFVEAGGNQLDALLAAPLVGLFGTPGWTWAWGLALLLANGASAHWLARSLGASRVSALAAASVFLLHPYALNELAMGRPTQAVLFWTPLALGLLLRSRRDPSWRWPVLAGLGFAAQAWTWWFMGHLSLLVLGPLVLVLAARERAWWPRLAVAAGTALLAVLPGVLPMLLRASAGEVPGYSGEREGFLDDLASLETMGWWALAPSQGPVAVPVWLLGLLLGSVALARERLAWGLALLVAVLLAAGPLLSLSVGSPPNPLWSLAELLPGWGRLFYPYRALALVAVLGVPLLALALEQVPRAWRWLGLAAPLALLASGPLPSTALQEPEYAALVRAEPGPVLNLPWRCAADVVHEQVWHRSPSLGAQTENLDAYFPAGVQRALDEDPLLGPLAALSRGAEARPSSRAYDRQIRWVVLHRTMFDPQVQRGRSCADGPVLPARIERSLRDWLGEPISDDGERALWALR